MKKGGKKTGSGPNNGKARSTGKSQRGSGQGEAGNRSGQPGSGLDSGPGQGRRPYRDGDAEFEKQKVQGKLRQGAITGLSHFRGEGAKGDAPEQFVEAMKAAKEDAESSLELERIPSDAREMVKEYYSGVNEKK